MSEAEQVEQGQPAPEAASDQPSAPAPEQAPEQTHEATSAKYSGKSLEELAREMDEKDRYIQEVHERAARAEHEALLTRNLVEQFSRERGSAREPEPSSPEVSDDEFLTNPAKATSKIIESYFARERAERDRERVGQYVSNAKSAYEAGKAEAMKANPNLYRGIETDLSREVLATIQSSLQAGKPVDASYIRNPKYWEAAALAFRVMNGEDVTKYYSRHNVPMTPGHTETPTPGPVPKGEMTLTPEQEELISRANITREQFITAWNKERGIAEGRAK